METPLCLNCNNRVESSEKEFCNACLADLDQMVDAEDLNIKSEVDMEENFNPFFGRGRMTGSIRSKSGQTVEGVIDDEGGASFLRGLFLLTIVLILMAIIVPGMLGA